MLRLLYVANGLLIWFGSFVLIRWVVGATCGRLGPAFPVAVTVLAVAACAGVMYHALSRARLPQGAPSDSRRMAHFAAGGSAALGLAAIAATAWFSAAPPPSC